MLRIRFSSIGKLLALAVFVAIISTLIVYLRIRGKGTTKSEGRPVIEGKLVAVFNNTRYAHEVDGRVRFVLSAGTDRAYEDGTHQLENVSFESHGADGTRSDRVTADYAKVSDT